MTAISLLLNFAIVIIGVFELIKQNKEGVDGYSGLIFGYTLYYGVIPLLINFLKSFYTSVDQYGFDVIDRYVFSVMPSNKLIISVLSLIFLVSCILIRRYVLRIPFRKLRIDKQKLNKFDANKIDHKIFIIASVMQAIVILMILSLVFTTGGIVSSLAVGSTLRSHTENSFEYLPPLISYGRYFLGLSIPSCYMYFYVLLRKQNKIRILAFSLSILIAIYCLLFQAGRMNLVLFFIPFIVILLSLFTRWIWSIIFAAASAMMPLLDLMETVFTYFKNGLWTGFRIDYPNYIRQFAFPYMVSNNVFEITERYGYWYFKDFITEPLSLIPGVSTISMYEHVSNVMRGDSWRKLGGIPTDIFTHGYLELNVIGILVISFIIVLLTLLMRVVMELKLMNKIQSLFYGAINATVFYSIVPASDLAPIFKNFTFLTLVIVNLVALYFIYFKQKQVRRNIDKK